MTDVNRWRRIEQVLDAALSIEPTRWSSMLDESCSGDPEMRAEIEQLLAKLPQAAGFLSTPPGTAARALIDSADATASASFVDRRIGAYHIEREIGRGGMSRVFLARRADGQYEQHVALKLLRPGLDSELDLERLRTERQILARLSHPNIARLLDGGVTEEGRPYLVLEYVDGVPIDRYCAERNLTLLQRLELFTTVATAAQYAHRNLVVHRDLKPSNIVVANDGTVKLLDFGLAKLLEQDDAGDGPHPTRTGQRWMTPEYAAPEQIRSETITTLTDVYQLGAVLYELVTGSVPFPLRDRNLHALEEAVLHNEPALPSSVAADGRAIRGDLDAIIAKALRKEPERRYPSAAAMVDDIERFRAKRPVQARSDSTSYRLRKFVGRHQAGVATAAVGLVLLAGGAIRERTLRNRAEGEASKAKAVEEYLVSVFDVADPFAPPSLRSGDVTARALLDRGAARLDSALADHTANQAELRTVFGRVYANLGLYDQAAAQLRRSLADRRAIYGQRHVAVADAMDELGQTLFSQQKLDEAEPLLRDAVAQRREFLGSRNAMTAASIEHLAGLLRVRNNLPAADSLYREALAIRRDVLGPRDVAVAQGLSQLGLLLFVKGAYDEAEPLHREALSIQQEKLGKEHPRTAQTLQNLAQVQQLRGKVDEAEALYRQALDVKRKALGNAHPSVTISLNNLGLMLMRERGRVDQAEPLIREALALDRQMFGENHGYVAASLDNLGTVLREKGDLDGAEQAHREALAVNRAVYGPKNSSIGLNLNSIAGDLRLKGESDKAVPLLRDAVGTYASTLGPAHMYTLTVEMNLARALRESGSLAEAERTFRAVAARVDSGNPAHRPILIGTRVGLGQTLAGAGRARDALPLLQQGAELALAQFGATHAVTADARLALGTHLLSLGQYDKAEPMLTAAYGVLEKRRQSQARLAAQSARALAQLYQALGRPAEARRYAQAADRAQ